MPSFYGKKLGRQAASSEQTRFPCAQLLHDALREGIESASTYDVNDARTDLSSQCPAIPSAHPFTTRSNKYERSITTLVSGVIAVLGRWLQNQETSQKHTGRHRSQRRKKSKRPKKKQFTCSSCPAMKMWQCGIKTWSALLRTTLRKVVR